MTTLTFFWLLISVALFSGLMYYRLSNKGKFMPSTKSDIWAGVLICILWPAAVVFIVADTGVEKLTDWVNK